MKKTAKRPVGRPPVPKYAKRTTSPVRIPIELVDAVKTLMSEYRIGNIGKSDIEKLIKANEVK